MIQVARDFIEREMMLFKSRFASSSSVLTIVIKKIHEAVHTASFFIWLKEEDSR